MDISGLILFISQIPPPVLLPMIMLGFAPFVPQPHLFEKLTLLRNGQLVKPIDIFDLFMHGIPLFVAILSILLRVFYLQPDSKPHSM